MRYEYSCDISNGKHEGVIPTEGPTHGLENDIEMEITVYKRVFWVQCRACGYIQVP
jgi:hypothetical protein